MKKWQFKGILTQHGWLSPAYLTTEEGIIKEIGEGSLEKPDANLEGYLLPGFQNSHSHAFQYAMAGITENRHSSGIRDNFWSWRSAMYEIALKIDPEQMRDIAAMVYTEMVKNGFTSVAEFHYLHHDKNGKVYADPAELGHQLIEAAKSAGIRITLIPIFYQNGGFGKKAEKYQRRFTHQSVDDYLHLLECSEKHVKNHEHASLGNGVHSLRAADKESVSALLSQEKKHLPFHMHISEQLREVQECLEHYGQRPVRWFLENYESTTNMNLVHATHLSETEVQMLGKSNANVVLCPTTEGNLGDGIFPLKNFQKNGGKWSIGTDSHIGINPMEELRLLDYGQRLVSHERNTFHHDGDSGLFAIRTAWQAGRRAMGSPDEDFFVVGQPMDGVVIGNENPLIATASKANLLSTFLYSANPRDYKGTIVQGEWIYKDGQSKNGGPINRNFFEVLKQLKIR